MMILSLAVDGMSSKRPLPEHNPCAGPVRIVIIPGKVWRTSTNAFGVTGCRKQLELAIIAGPLVS
jgi:hypothetical protein